MSHGIFPKINLKTRMIGGLLMMGLLVFTVAWFGWSSTSELSQHINLITKDTLPSIIGLWKINQGHTQIHLAERTLLNPRTSQELRDFELNKIQQAWVQIEEGFQEYNASAKTPEEKQMYEKFMQNWNKWKKDHQKFLNLYDEFEKLGILKPGLVQVELLKQGKENSPEMAAAKAASAVFDRVNWQAENQKDPSFLKAQKSLSEILNINENRGSLLQKDAEKDASASQILVVLGMMFRPIAAIVLGILLSNYLMGPIEKAIYAIASFSAQVASTVEEQERITIKQAAAVQEITTTIDELSTSSQQATKTAEEADMAAKQALAVVREGTETVEQTFEGMAILEEKVSAIARSITSFQQQASLISNISSTVTELANQTNLLALNATVEAVRAGEQGKGFAVVATEIRRLADESKRSAAKINTSIGDIKTAINLTVKATNEGTTTVNEGVKIAQKTTEAFTNVAESINQLVLNNRQIALSSYQQTMAIDQLVQAMNTINTSARETTTGIMQTKAGTQKLNEAARSLKALGA